MSTPTKPTEPQLAAPEPTGSTHLVMVLDRSGSMASIRADVIGGWNEFLRGQQELPGKATLTQIQFDSQDPFEVVHHFKPLQDVPPLTNETFVPRGGTPLLDALGKAITSTSMDLAAAAPGNRPERVLFVCITDGQENASRQYSKEAVTQMVERMKGGGWEFVFLSSDLAAVHEAAQLGFNPDSAMQFQHSQQGMRRSMSMMSEKMAHYRSGRLNNISFSVQERAFVMNPDAQIPEDKQPENNSPDGNA